jgi:hypothetical protein
MSKPSIVLPCTTTLYVTFAHQSPCARWSAPRAALIGVCSRVPTGRTLLVCNRMVDTSSRQAYGTGTSALLGALEKDAFLQPLPPSVRTVGVVGPSIGRCRHPCARLAW